MTLQATVDPRAALLDELVVHAYQFSPEKPFLLVSGQYSDEYLDCKLALSQPRAMAVAWDRSSFQGAEGTGCGHWRPHHGIRIPSR